MRKKMAFLFIVAVLVPLVSSTYIIVDLVRSRMETALRRRMDDNLAMAGNLFDRFMEDMSLKTRVLSQMKEIQDLVAMGDRVELLDRLFVHQGDLNLSAYSGILEAYDINGVLLASVPPRREPAAEPERMKSALSGVLASAVSSIDETLTATISHPIYHPGKAGPTGALCLTCPLSDRVADDLAKVLGSDVVLYRWQGGRTKVLASSMIRSGSRIYPLPPVSASPSMAGPMKVEIQGGKYLLGSRDHNFRNTTLGIGVLVDREDLESMSVSLVRALLWISGFTLLAALTISAIFSRVGIIAPINRLVMGARSIENGDLETPVGNLSSDEFGILASTFDSMREKIKSTITTLDARVRDLTLMDRINNSIVSISEGDPLADILRIICEHTGAGRASILLMDDNLKALVLRVAYSMTEGETQGTRDFISFAPGEGIAGKVAQTGEMIVTSCAGMDDRYKPYPEESRLKGSMGSLVCLPLKGDKGILGVINISDIPGAIPEADEGILMKVASQVAIAIQKSTLYELAITDGLTRLFIHRYFQARLETEIQRAKRYGSKVSLIMFDVDHFKRFNDTHGHQAGDMVLRKVAAIVRAELREGLDIPARYGGEEFAVIMPELDLDRAFSVAERLRRAVEGAEIEFSGKKLKVTISLGCSEYPQSASDRESLIKKSDQALYASKETGRNRATKS